MVSSVQTVNIHGKDYVSGMELRAPDRFTPVQTSTINTGQNRIKEPPEGSGESIKAGRLRGRVEMEQGTSTG